MRAKRKLTLCMSLIFITLFFSFVSAGNLYAEENTDIINSILFNVYEDPIQGTIDKQYKATFTLSSNDFCFGHTETIVDWYVDGVNVKSVKVSQSGGGSLYDYLFYTFRSIGTHTILAKTTCAAASNVNAGFINVTIKGQCSDECSWGSNECKQINNMGTYYQCVDYKPTILDGCKDLKVSSDCPQTPQTCSNLGGAICSSSQSCDGNWLYSSNERCCVLNGNDGGAGRCYTPVIIPSIKTYPVVFVVKDTLGNPVENAKTEITPSLTPLMGNLLTSSTGKVGITLPTGKFRSTTTKDGYQTKSGDFEVIDQGLEITITIVNTGTTECKQKGFECQDNSWGCATIDGKYGVLKAYSYRCSTYSYTGNTGQIFKMTQTCCDKRNINETSAGTTTTGTTTTGTTTTGTTTTGTTTTGTTTQQPAGTCEDGTKGYKEGEVFYAGFTLANFFGTKVAQIKPEENQCCPGLEASSQGCTGLVCGTINILTTQKYKCEKGGFTRFIEYFTKALPIELQPYSFIILIGIAMVGLFMMFGREK